MRKNILIILILIIIFAYPSTPLNVGSQQNEDIQPLAFFKTSPGSNFPSIHPIGIKVDGQGNINSWLFYIPPESNPLSSTIDIYYSVTLKNGTTLFEKVDSQPVVLTFMSIFYKQNFAELNDGHVVAFYVKASDFGVTLRELGYQNNIIINKNIKLPSGITINGNLIGPILINQTYEYYLPILDSNNNKQMLQIKLDGSGKITISQISYPNLFNVFDVFDIAYANNSRYWLTSIPQSQTYSTLNLIKENLTNFNFTLVNTISKYNVAPSNPSLHVLDNILTDILRPKLISTNTGHLFSFISSLDGNVNNLFEWTNSGLDDILKNLPENPFQFAFLPSVGVYKNEIRISALSFQFAQSVATISADIFTVNVTNVNLPVITHDKYQDQRFSSSIFIFAADLTSPYFLALIGTITTPSFVRNDFYITNSTVGTAFIISSEQLPQISPFFVDVSTNKPSSIIATTNYTETIIVILLSLWLILSVSFFLMWRKKQYELPPIIITQRGESKQTLITKIKHGTKSFANSYFIFIKANYRRFILSISVLIIPTMLLSALFLGVLSHQAFLLQTYQTQNPVNDTVTPMKYRYDFVWNTNLYKDEFSNSTFNVLDWNVPQELSRQTLIKYGVEPMSQQLNGISTFPLFDKRNSSYVNSTGYLIKYDYPFPFQFAILNSGWTNFINSILVQGRLPEKPNEVLVQNNYYVNRDPAGENYPYGDYFKLNQTLNFYASELDIYLNTSIPKLNQNVTIVGKISKIDSLSFDYLKTWAQKLNTTVDLLRLLDKIPIISFPQYITPFLNNFSRVSLRPQNYVQIRYDVFAINRNEIPTYISNFKTLSSNIIQQTGFAWIGNFTDTRITSFLQDYYDASRQIELQATILTIPALVLILFLTYESLGIGRSSFEQEFIRFKKEGLRTEKIFAYIVTERLITSFIASLISYIFLAHLTQFFLDFTGFFNLDFKNSPPVLTNNSLEISFFVFLLLFLVGMIQSMRIFMKSEDWRYKNNLGGVKFDLALIVIGATLVYVSNYFANYFADQVSITNQSNSIDPNTELVLISMRLVSLLIASLGGLIVISKVFNRLFIFIGFIGWKLSRKPNGLMFNGIRMHTSIYGKSLLIFILSIFLIIPMLTIPATLNLKYQQDAYYTLNTDIIVDNWNTITPNMQNLVLHLKNIEYTSTYFFGILEFKNGLQIRTLAIDPNTFTNTIYIPDKYIQQFQYNVSEIKSLRTGEMIVNSLFTRRNALYAGDNVSLGFQNNNETVNLYISNSYNDFPIVDYELSNLQGVNTIPLGMVINFNTLKMIQDKYLTNSTQDSITLANLLDSRKLLIKSNNVNDISSINSQIQASTGLTTTSLSQLIQKNRHPFFRTFEFLTHISVIIASIGPLLSTLIFIDVLFQRRKSELEVYRRAGKSTHFFVYQLYTEFLISVLIPSLIGILIGYWWSQNYGAELFGQKTQDLVWIFNFAIVFIWVGVLLILSSIIWIVRLQSYSKRYLDEVRL